MITTTEDGAYRVSCLDIDCPRPLARTVATMSHAANLERKHEREFHGESETDESAELAKIIYDASPWGGMDEHAADEVARTVLAAGYVKAPF